jgi:hypothetical protein
VRGSLASNSRRYALQLRKDRGENAFLVAQDIRIPESQYVIAVCAERGIAPVIPRIIRVLSTVNFDDQFFLTTNEIDDIRADRLLPNEFETSQTSVAQSKPQLRFGICGVAPKAAFESSLRPLRSAHGMPLTRLAPSVLATLSPLRGAREEIAARSVSRSYTVQRGHDAS